MTHTSYADGPRDVGVCEALREHNLGHYWITGALIGAINGAPIAGSPPNCGIETVEIAFETR